MIKRVSVAVVCLLMVHAGAWAKEAPLDTDQKKASYAVGQQVGHDLKNQGVDLSLDAFSQGVADAMRGRESRLAPEAMRQALQDMQSRMTARRQQEGDKNRAAGQKFLDENRKRPGVKVTASGLQYEVLQPGKGVAPKATDRVRVHYRGTLINGNEFDSSYKNGQPVEFPLNGVIRGWTEGLQLMKAGGKQKLYIPSELAYGQNSPPGIPANSVLIFEVDLLDVLK